MIREARLEDIPAMVNMGRDFFCASGYADITVYDAASAEATLRMLIEQESSIAIVAVADDKIVGMAAAMTFPLYLNHAHYSGQELFWWLSPQYRGTRLGLELINGLESTAKSKGCHSFVMMSLDRSMPERLDRLYRKRGYRRSEHTYIRKLGG